VILVLSPSANPASFFGGTVVPDAQSALLIPLSTNAQGLLSLPFQGGGGPQDVYAQYLVSDPGATLGVSLSNAVRVTLQP